MRSEDSSEGFASDHHRESVLDLSNLKKGIFTTKGRKSTKVDFVL